MLSESQKKELREASSPISDKLLAHWLLHCEAKTRAENGMAARIVSLLDENEQLRGLLRECDTALAYAMNYAGSNSPPIISALTKIAKALADPHNSGSKGE